MMADRYSRPKQRSWFVPTVVVVGIAAFFLWESGWRPFEILDVPTGSVSGEPGSPAVADVDAFDGDPLPDITPQQFEPDIHDLDPSELLDVLNPQETSTTANSTSAAGTGIDQVGFETDSPGFDSTAFDAFADLPEPNAPSAPSATYAPTAVSPTPPVMVASPPPIPAELQAKLNKIDFLLDENDYLTAHRDLSTLYWYEPQHRPVIRERIQHTAKSIYAAAHPHYMEPYVVEPGETLGKIAAKYQVPWTYLAKLNNVEPSRVRAGSKLKVIRGPFGAVVDLSDFELTIHAHGYYVRSYKIGTGADLSTPIGEFKVGQKLENPTYYPPEGGVVDGNDPTNPLGEYWLSIGDGYGIHGTIDPGSIGKAESKGCIRMLNEDVEEVFDLLTEGSTVMIRR